MSFSSIHFFIFLFVFVTCFYASRGRLHLWITLLGSYAFLSFSNWQSPLVLFTSTFVDYLLCRGLSETRTVSTRKRFLFISIAFNILILGLFKYFNFFVEAASDLALFGGVSAGTTQWDILLPLGISFYSFQKMGYMIDVYRGTIAAEHSFPRFACFIAFFPKLTAGPIVEAKHFLPQMDASFSRRFDIGKAERGIRLVLWGLTKKLVIANSLALVVDPYFKNPEFYTSLSIMLAVFFYAFQIYCDFSGYSDIAIGIALILGFDLGLNFNYPYFSKGFSEFWTRWHISLSFWFRYYLYIPLGGNRKGLLRQTVNTFITMILCGFWHGANWTFLAWGFLHSVYLVAERLLQRIKIPFSSPGLSKAIRYCRMLAVFLFVCFAWVFFRADSMDNAWLVLHRIFSFNNMSFAGVTQSFWVVRGLLMIMVLLAVESAVTSGALRRWTETLRGKPAFRIAAYASSVWCMALFGVFSGNTFIYSQF